MFQSTRPRGARLGWPALTVSNVSFNPRARVGRDGAEGSLSGTLSCFNPRARVGRDRWPTGYGKSITRFQSTRPRGARPNRLRRTWAKASFNPRARVGRDRRPRRPARRSRHVSIHAPAWGATCAGPARREEPVVSIHAPAWGATAARVLRAWGPRPFQSTRPRGARRCARQRGPRGAGFNPRARVGRDCMSLIIKNFVRLQNRFRRTSPSGA